MASPDAALEAWIDEQPWASLWEAPPAVALLNHGSYGRTFRRVRAEQCRIDRAVDADPGRFFRHDHAERLEAAAAELGAWLGVGEGHSVAFVPNASAGVLDAVAGLAGGNRVVLLTNLAYGGIVIGLEHLAPRLDLVLHYVEFGSLGDVAGYTDRIVEAAERLRPAVVVLDQIASSTALRLPVAEAIAAIAGVSPATRVVVDGAHAAGMEPEPWVAGAAAWVANLHKWVCAAPGAAVLVAPTGSNLAPLRASWTGIEPFPDSFLWTGTAGRGSYLSAPLAARILTGLRRRGLDAHIRDVLAEATEFLGAAWDVAPDARPDGMRCPWMGLLEVPVPAPLSRAGRDAAIRAARTELAADVAVTGFGTATCLRLSAHGYNRADEYRRLVDLPRVLARI